MIRFIFVFITSFLLVSCFQTSKNVVPLKNFNGIYVIGNEKEFIELGMIDLWIKEYDFDYDAYIDTSFQQVLKDIDSLCVTDNFVVAKSSKRMFIGLETGEIFNLSLKQDKKISKLFDRFNIETPLIFRNWND